MANKKNDKIKGSTYSKAGVETMGKGSSIEGLISHVRETLKIRKATGKAVLDIGYYANVIKAAPNLGIAISTDGVGTKILVAEAMGRYDTIGIDCIAMNANDVVCVGAEPVSMVDYIAVEKADSGVLEQVGRGLRRGAELAGINIPGGELAQVREMIRGSEEGKGLDLVGTCIGIVELDKIITGKNAKPGDVVIGIESSGLHSNGYTLARKVLLGSGKFKVDSYIPELGRTLGEELLEPTFIYVKEIVEILKKGINVKALFHITGDGLLNLSRIEKPIGFVLDNLPPRKPVFDLIMKEGVVSLEEMYHVFNMGIGFSLIVPEDECSKTLKIISSYGKKAFVMGKTVKDYEKRVILPSIGLEGSGDGFRRI